MEIKNISGIDFEDRAEDEEYVKDLRCPNRQPLDFNQEDIKKHIGDLLTKPDLKVLEIGCGWGRNAQFFKETTNIKYFGFDPSPTSLNLFKKQKFPKDRFYVADSINDKILKNKYDLIFSTYVLQHIGFPKDEPQFGCYAIMQTLLPCLNDEGFLLFHELYMGQNHWDPAVLVAFLRSERFHVEHLRSTVLAGGDKDGHDLIVAKR